MFVPLSRLAVVRKTTLGKPPDFTSLVAELDVQLDQGVYRFDIDSSDVIGVSRN